MVLAVVRIAALPYACSSFEQDGYLTPLDVLSASEINATRAAFDKLQAMSGVLAPLVDQHMKEPFLWDLVTNTRLLDSVGCILGPDVMVLGSQFFCKPPSTFAPRRGAHISYHQDVYYWGLDPAEAVSAWIAIDDVDNENGCMRVLKSSHRKLLPHGTSQRPGNMLSVNQEIDSEHLRTFPHEQAIILKAGQSSLHDGRAVHASFPNTSPTRRRCGLAVRYISPHVQPRLPASDEEINQVDSWRPVLVRGRDTFGHWKGREVPTPACAS